MENIFIPADILVPANADMHKWSVVACDQYTSQPEYWAEIESLVGDAPSTLRLMLPEAYLGTKDVDKESELINERMREYLDAGVYKELHNSFILVRRTLADGKVRTGLIGAIDLDKYDFSLGSKSPVRATEGTVPSRLPPRVKVREGACLEMPHIMVFINDTSKNILGSLANVFEQSGTPIYDFSLSGNGGSIKGYAVTGQLAEGTSAAITSLGGNEDNPLIFAIGDGNHSLATAKVCWENIKSSLTEEEMASHPARYSLVELVNIHDDAITFEPIHRVLFDTDEAEFFSFIKDNLTTTGENEFIISLYKNGENTSLTIKDTSIGTLISRCEAACQKYISLYGGSIDYVHNDDYAIEMGSKKNCCSLLLPPMRKDELFSSVQQTGPFPKKSFSIGLAQDKRYYLECRKIIK